MMMNIVHRVDSKSGSKHSASKKSAANDPTVLQATVRVRNPHGIHARPANHIVKLLYFKKDQVFFTYKEFRVDGKSVLNLLLLGATQNAKIKIEVSGPTAQETLKQLQDAFETGLGDITL